MEKREQLFQFLKRERAASLEQLAKELAVSPDFIKGMVESEGEYRKTDWREARFERIYHQKGDFILLAGLGVERCIICGDDYLGRYNSVSITLPEEMLKGYQFDSSSLKGIKGHRKCYSTIDTFFRYDQGLVCWDCVAWGGQWVDGDEMEERCYKLNEWVAGHPGVLGSKRMCNFFELGSYYQNGQPIPEEEIKGKRERWEEIKLEITKRTEQGYQNLISILERACLIEKK